MSSIDWAVPGQCLLSRIGKACAAGAILLMLTVASAAGDNPKRNSIPWAPPDIDRVFPPVNTEVPCALGGVLKSASQRVQDLVVNMQRFSATEQVAFEEMDRNGGLRTSKSATFSYVAYIQETATHQLTVEEYRNDMTALQDFPSKVATLGTAAFALIFHPKYLKDFAVTCEGLSDWKGRRAWRLRLVQVQANNFRGYRLANRYFLVMLKARAWIDAETFEVLRLETDLREPIAEIPLLLEHVIVEYSMVDFPRRHLQLWLPREAEIYMDYRGHQYHHRHSFSRFQLFWVDTEETVKAPQVATSEPSDLPTNISNPPVKPPLPMDSAAGERRPSAGNAMANLPLERTSGGSGGTVEQYAPTSVAANSVFVPATTQKADVTGPPPPAASPPIVSAKPPLPPDAASQADPTAPAPTAKPVLPPAATPRTDRPAPAATPATGSAQSELQPPATPNAAATHPPAPAANPATGSAQSELQPPATPNAAATHPPAPAANFAASTAPAPSGLQPPAAPKVAVTDPLAPAATAPAAATELAVTVPPNLKERSEAVPHGAKTASDLGECPECLRVLISQRDDRGMVRDNWRSQAQDDWLRRNGEQLLKGKGVKIRVTATRGEAQYNIVWSVGFVQATAYKTMRADVMVFEIESGQRLFFTSRESRYWEVDHPENKCLQDAITFLKDGYKRPQDQGFSMR